MANGRPQPPENVNHEESSFIAKINQSFGWLRRQPSDLIPWWLPSTDSVPGVLATAEEEQPPEVESKVDEDSPAEGDDEDSLASSSSDDDEADSTENKKDDTDVEVEDLPADFGAQVVTEAVDIAEIPEELGDRSSPDGFEWPENNSPPLRTHSFYRSYSPYDNVKSNDNSPAVDPVAAPSAWQDTFDVWQVGYEQPSLKGLSRRALSTESSSSSSSSSSESSSSTSSSGKADDLIPAPPKQGTPNPHAHHQADGAANQEIPAAAKEEDADEVSQSTEEEDAGEITLLLTFLSLPAASFWLEISSPKCPSH